MLSAPSAIRQRNRHRLMRNVFLLPLLLVPALLGAQVKVEVEVNREDSVRRDSVRRSGRREVKRIPVTPAHLATAFRDDRARQLLLGARRARLAHDSALRAYDATTYMRMSAGLAVKAVGRERLMFRHENATRVRWQQGVGAVVDVKGARTVVPAFSSIKEARDEIETEMSSEVGGDIAGIPYFPGQETLWIGAGRAQTEVDERELVHPLAEGAEAYYKYALGDSMSYRLPQGTVIKLSELRIQPREPRWNLVVGSFWFDAATHQLVRAAYRLSVEMDIWEVAKQDDPDVQDDIPAWVMPMLTPMRAKISAITVEYGLYEGRFWLPRLQAAEGEGQMSFMRVPVRIEERYDYASVNGTDTMPTLPPRPPVSPELLELERLDSLAHTGDSLARNQAVALRKVRAEAREAARTARRDTLRMLDSLAREGDDSARARAKAMRAPAPRQCDTSTARVRMTNQTRGGTRIMVKTPCDPAVLANAPELPKSIYDEGDEIFNGPDLTELRGLLDMGLQSEWAPQPIRLRYGLGDGMLRYNRVEGLSPALGATQALGRGYTADGLVRIGFADWQPNAELGISRNDGRRNIRVGAFRRLGVANDWGTPLGFGSSLSSVLFSRDEGFYYRTWGAELVATGLGNPNLTWRAFGERHDDADVETNLSVANLLNDVRFLPNIDASAGTIVGAEARIIHSYGDNPRGFRAFTSLRGESGVGDFIYTRALADITLSRAVLPRLDGALTLSAGSTTAGSPRQRWFYLGGSQTIRGQQAGAMSGETFWMTRVELGTSFVTARPVVFADMGWAGPADRWTHPGRPASGAGVGASFMDGLVRFDIARGIFPRKGFRSDLYIEARF
jgi:hypothetical protein